MTAPITDDGERPADPRPQTDGLLVAEVVDATTERVECTIYPSAADGVDLMTRWITAGEDSFVGLDDLR